MKRGLVVILSVLLGLLSGVQCNDGEQDAVTVRQAMQEYLQTEQHSEEGGYSKQHFAIEQKGVVPTRDYRIQTTQIKIGRSIKTVVQLTQEAYQKRQNNLHKVSEYNQIVKSINYSSLRKRAGYWIYVLRKLLI